MADYDFYESLGRIAEFTHRSNIQITGSFGMGGKDNHRGYEIEIRSAEMRILGFADRSQFNIEHRVDLFQYFASAMSVEEAKRYVNGEKAGQELFALAAEKRLNSIEEETIEEIHSRIVDEFYPSKSSVQNISHRPREGEDIWNGIKVSQSAYPHSDQYTVQDFEETTIEVLNDGQEIVEIIREVLELDESQPIEDIEPDDGPGPGRSFA